MIRILPESKEGFLAVAFTGKATAEDYETVFIPELEKRLAEYGKLDCAVVMEEDFSGWTGSAVLDDVTWGLKHRDDFRRLAVAGGPKWVHWGAKVDGHFMDGDVRTFSLDQVAEAMAWAQTGAM